MVLQSMSLVIYFLNTKYSVEKNRTIITNVQPERKSVLDNILPVSNLLVRYLSVYLINNVHSWQKNKNTDELVIQ